MMNDYTPGPWKVSPYDPHVVVKNGIVLVRDQTEANARLIAAAPELYDFVRAIAEMTDEGSINEHSIVAPGVTLRRRARQLFAKAKGQP